MPALPFNGSDVKLNTEGMRSQLQDMPSSVERGSGSTLSLPKPEMREVNFVSQGAGTPQYTKSSLQLGQQMHSSYKAGLADGVTTFKEFTGVKGIRPDFVDFGKKTIYELKPFNPRSVQLGIKQLNNYKAIFEREYPGTIWKTVLDTY